MSDRGGDLEVIGGMDAEPWREDLIYSGSA